jgi:hypothetical protein
VTTATIERSPLLNGKEILWKPHEGPQTEFLRRQEDIVLYGGTKGPGKTDALLFGALRQIEHPQYKALILRRTFPQLQDAIDRSQAIFPALGAVWSGDSKRWTFPSGATVAFGHCASEIDKLRYQGQEYTYIGIDQVEEFTESMVNFIIMQNRTSAPGLKCRVRLTANPGGPGQAWVRRWFIYLLDDGGRKVGKKKPFETYSREFKLPDGRRMTRTSCFVPGTIYDNPTLLKNNPTYLANLMDKPEAERKAFLEGDWEAFLSQCVFDKAGMKAQMDMVEDPRFIGLLRDAGHEPEFVLDDLGPLKIWRQPVARRRYFIFADVSKGPNIEGVTPDGRDYSCAGVFDWHSHDLVAEWHGQVDPLEFGKVLYGLGLYYNKGKIAVEAWPGPGGSTVKKLVELKYPSIYKHLAWDGERHVDTSEYGWITDTRSRYDMIATLQEAIRKKDVLVRSADFLDEMENFIRKESGKSEAREGCHDDRVIVLAGALHCMKFDPVAEMAGDDRDNEDSPLVVTRLVGRSSTGVKHGPAWRQTHAGMR